MTNTAASTSIADLATTFVMFRLQQLVAARVPGLRQHGQPTLPVTSWAVICGRGWSPDLRRPAALVRELVAKGVAVVGS